MVESYEMSHVAITAHQWLDLDSCHVTCVIQHFAVILKEKKNLSSPHCLLTVVTALISLPITSSYFNPFISTVHFFQIFLNFIQV